ncbi:MAG TPA: ferrous iron transport protein B [Candidatus Margulisbacteria bacterium]|nr:MAG: ferrous iron transport protein B [Candidatus Margulisbacteria bacterium GWE2_39_32]HCT84688.1 ferrous iron transport protein B [Candidatus Margulisiibacteriota bacterium]
MSGNERITVAVAGNPNCGKSTLINALAGSRLQVGNWAGVTVEKKFAELNYNGTAISLVDLPGTYSLSPYSQEEIIARDYLVNEKPDIILNVIDSTNLERNLYLTIQLLELGIPVVIALNIYDEAQQKGYEINIPEIQRLLGVEVIPTVSTQKKGMDSLLNVLVGNVNNQPKRQYYGKDLESAIDVVQTNIKDDRRFSGYASRWLAIKLLEEDEYLLRSTGVVDLTELTGEAVGHLAVAHDEDIESQIVDERYALASGLFHQVFKQTFKPKQELTEKIDKIVLNKYLGIPVFVFMMWLTFKLTFDVGNPFVGWIDGVIGGPLTKWAGALLAAVHAPEWFVSLILNGVIAGVGGVLVFIPVIATMMFFVTFLEASGYMARAAFIMDRMMHKIGLHGKAFIPLLLGFGCNVPSIYSTRILETRRDKLLTALLVPLISCGARLPVYLLFATVFFPRHAANVILSLYLLGIAIAIFMGFVFKHTLFRAEAPVFIMELPPYRLPSVKNLLIHSWEKVKHFVVKAGTLILVASVVIWFSLNLPYGVSQQDSLLGKTGKAIAPILQPLGFGTWEAGASLLTGFVAKEVVVSTMGEIYSGAQEERTEQLSFVGDLKAIVVSFGSAVQEAFFGFFSNIDITGISSSKEEEGLDSLKQRLGLDFTPLSAYSFMVFVLLYVPCLTVLAAFKHEFQSWGWVGFVVVYLSVLPWLVSFAVYQGGRLVGLG